MDGGGQQPAPPPLQEPGLLAQAGALWAELRGLAHEQLRLALLEAKQAGTRFAVMLALALAAGALSATAWLGLVAALVLTLVEHGFSPAWAVLMAVAANLAGAIGCVALLWKLGGEMPFAATLRSIRGDS